MKRLNDLYEQITPETSPEELAQKIMNTKTKPIMKKRSSKVMTAILAAAVSVSVLTVSVGAANGWDYAGIFRSIFDEKSENITENIVPEATVLYDTIDTMNFELAAVAADKHSVLAILDIYSENGYKLIEEIDGVTVVKPFQDLFICINSDALGSSGTGVHIIEQSEEKLRLGVRMGTENMIKGEKVTVQAWLQNPKDENGEYLFEDGAFYSWAAEFAVDYIADEIRYEKNMELLGGAKLESVEISSISACFEGERVDDFFADHWNAENAYVILDSGEKVSINQITGSSYTEGDETGSTLIILGFEEPVNPDEVCAVAVGGQSVEIK
ncbi:MAG: hypothetical protein IJ007_06785 [Oscillospiraceae bacterium]|nr:hypothetical protein [Oscillospiraceae bacterium]